MKTIKDDDRATSQTIGVIALCAVMVGGMTFAAAGLHTQFESETESHSTVDEAHVDVIQSDQVGITPMVGDDLELKNAEVRISFLDRDAPDAVVTNLGAGMEQSETKEITYEQEVNTVQQAGAVTQEYTYYEQDGWQTHTEVEVYEYEQEYEVEKHVHEWDILWTDQWISNDDVHMGTVQSATEPDPSDHRDFIPAIGVWRDANTVEKADENLIEFTIEDRSGDKETVVAAEEPSTSWGEDIVDVEYATETVTETQTVEHHESPGDDWEKVSNEPVGTETYELEEPVRDYNEVTEEVTVGHELTTTTETVEETTEVYVASGQEHEGESTPGASPASIATGALNTLAPVHTASASGYSGTSFDSFEDGDWGISSNAGSSSDYGTLSSMSSSSSSDESSDSETQTNTPNLGESSNNDESGPSPAEEAFNNAAEAAPFISGSSDGAADTESNAAIGVGGDAGSSSAAMWTQGEQIIVQLDEPRIAEDDRIKVQIIDTEDNSVALDQNVRADDLDEIALDIESPDEIDDIDGDGNAPELIDNDPVVDDDEDFGDVPGIGGNNPIDEHPGIDEPDSGDDETNDDSGTSDPGAGFNPGSGTSGDSSDSDDSTGFTIPDIDIGGDDSTPEPDGSEVDSGETDPLPDASGIDVDMGGGVEPITSSAVETNPEERTSVPSCVGGNCQTTSDSSPHDTNNGQVTHATAGNPADSVIEVGQGITDGVGAIAGGVSDVASADDNAPTSGADQVSDVGSIDSSEFVDTSSESSSSGSSGSNTHSTVDVGSGGTGVSIPSLSSGGSSGGGSSGGGSSGSSLDASNNPAGDWGVTL